MSEFRSGFVALIGRPNVGKSTFLNGVLNQKVSIISPKPQTTRNCIQGIYTTDNEQIIFIDTPGIHKPLHKLGNFMNDESLSTFDNVDLIMFIVDGTSDFGAGDQFIINELKKTKTPVYLIVNKIDLIKDKEKLMKNVIAYTSNYDFEEVYYISALKGNHVDELLSNISSKLEVGPMYFPKDQISDHPENFIIAEIIREKVLYLTKEEVPHSVAVVIEYKDINDDNPNLTDISAVIVVERQSQKKIIIGKNGQMIKEIGSRARKEIAMILGTKVYLELFVRVEDDWRNRSSQLKKLGYFTEK